MDAIPQLYPVTLTVPVSRFSESDRPVVLSGVLHDLIHIRETTVTDQGGRLKLEVAARNPADARRRAESAARQLDGQIVEVGEPSPLAQYARAGALPYGRSRVFGRYHRGRFNVQGGAGTHQPASPPPQPKSAVGEAVSALIGPPALAESVSEATDQQRAQRELRRKQWRSKNPGLARQRALTAKKTARARAGKLKSKRKQMNMRAKKFRGKFDPNFESMQENKVRKVVGGYTFTVKGSQTDYETGDVLKDGKVVAEWTWDNEDGLFLDVPGQKGQVGARDFEHAAKRLGESLTVCPLDKQLAGYPRALKVHEELKSIPESWFTTQYGRSTLVTAINQVREREGNTPADILETAYLHRKYSPPTSLEEPVRRASSVMEQHKVRVRFSSDRDQRFAVRNACRFSEACEDCKSDGDDATFDVSAADQEQAESVVESLLRKMNLSRARIVR